MSPTMQITAPVVQVTYTPVSDAMDRHEYGISKNRKPASTGGGRAWSDDEEVYLLQTRLQKMPYKHIAAHLKKTELACRLHYHQLSHGSNRRKRTTSVSSGSSTGGHSPILPAAMPSPIHEHSTPTPSPPGSSGSGFGHNHGHSHGLHVGHAHSHAPSHGPLARGGIQLPSIMTGSVGSSGSSSSGGGSTSPRLPAILPKPVSMTLALVTGSSGSAGRGAYPGDASGPSSSSSVASAVIPPPHSAPLLPAATFTHTPTSATAPPLSATTSRSTSGSGAGAPTLRLDCSSLPPLPPASAGPHHPVDMGRLHAVYAVHRSGFWSTVAAEYGHGASPVVLEHAWRTGGSGLGGSSSGGFPGSSSSNTGTGGPQQAATPLTPGTSPDDRDVFYNVKGGAQDKTRISAILGIDANPRSPKEREMVRRLEEERVVVPPVA